jgi:hypothetical protein
MLTIAREEVASSRLGPTLRLADRLSVCACTLRTGRPAPPLSMVLDRGGPLAETELRQRWRGRPIRADLQKASKIVARKRLVAPWFLPSSRQFDRSPWLPSQNHRWNDVGERLGSWRFMCLYRTLHYVQDGRMNVISALSAYGPRQSLRTECRSDRGAIVEWVLVQIESRPQQASKWGRLTRPPAPHSRQRAYFDL